MPNKVFLGHIVGLGVAELWKCVCVVGWVFKSKGFVPFGTEAIYIALDGASKWASPI